jgi:hypothetical protein
METSACKLHNNLFDVTKRSPDRENGDLRQTPEGDFETMKRSPDREFRRYEVKKGPIVIVNTRLSKSPTHSDSPSQSSPAQRDS